MSQEDLHAMSDAAPNPVRATVAEVIAAFIEQCQVHTVFGVISIHNMPMLDAIHRRGRIRYVGARGEAGAVNMADGHARVSGGLGVVFTSTGTAAGNAAGALVEALTAGTPLLHLTGQIETPFLDRDLAYIHEAPAQLAMLQAVSKAAYRVASASTALAVVREAVRVALTAPAGPVSVELPIDIQATEIDWPVDIAPAPVRTWPVDNDRVLQLAERLVKARRPLLWLGGGSRAAGEAVGRLLALGFGVVTSVQGRGVVAEDHTQSLGAFNVHPAVERFYQTCDALLVVGSRLRGNETLTYRLALPTPLYRIDANPLADQRGYPNALFLQGDASAVLHQLADALQGRLRIDPDFLPALAAARAEAEAGVQAGLGPYAGLVTSLRRHAGSDFNWVRDVTISNSTWGNRLLPLHQPRAGVHALGGGIGQGMPMAIGAALAGTAARTWCLVGDGGLMLNVGELATAVQERADVVILLMNDQAYGVIRNIQDAVYGGRRAYVELQQPDFGQLCRSLGLPWHRINAIEQADAVFQAALVEKGPVLIEVDMRGIGDFSVAFAGPPVKPAVVSEPTDE